MLDNINFRTKAIAALTEIFLESAKSTDNLKDLEDKFIACGHECMAQAYGLALEALDAELMLHHSDELKCHDIKERTLATEVGDVKFSVRRYRDKFNRDVYLLADVLDIPYNTRLSPGAISFLVDAAAHISYLKSARLLGKRGSSVSAPTVMKCMRNAGLLCAEEDRSAVEELYGSGVVPKAECIEENLCMEADGTFFSIQGAKEGSPKRFEIKAVVAYKGKEVRNGKVRRHGCVHHGVVGKPEQLWAETIACVGKKYDLTKIKHVHLGGDGEAWCRDAERFLPKASVTFHLDPFHINRAILSCFPAEEKEMAWNLIEVIKDGDKEVALELLRISSAFGIARKDRAEQVIAYLEGNIDAIAIDGPTLGTMESENQHLYGVRMDAFPCAWSLQGGSDMARIISRRESKRPIPKMSRERSMGKKRRKLREEKELKYYGAQGGAGDVLNSDGSGYLPPHQFESRKLSAGKAYALHGGIKF